MLVINNHFISNHLLRLLGALLFEMCSSSPNLPTLIQNNLLQCWTCYVNYEHWLMYSVDPLLSGQLKHVTLDTHWMLLPTFYKFGKPIFFLNRKLNCVTAINSFPMVGDYPTHCKQLLTLCDYNQFEIDMGSRQHILIFVCMQDCHRHLAHFKFPCWKPVINKFLLSVK